MTIEWIPILLLLSTFSGAKAHVAAQAASCSTSDVQTAINSAAEGGTVTIPAGTCTWTSGVTVSGKGIYIQGAGAGRIIAQSTTALGIATGSQTLSLTSSLVSGLINISNGETLTISETGNRQNYMIGTVTSYSSGTLVMNITSAGGSCGNSSSGTSPSNCKRWLISTQPSTSIIDDSSSTLFSLTEDSTVHTTISGIQFPRGTGTGDIIDIISGGGAAIIVNNIWIQQTGDVAIHVGVNRGVISNISCDSTPFSMAPICIDPQPFDQTSWTGTAYWGANDTNGQHNIYVETSDFHGYLLFTDNDEGARTVWRYNVLDNAGAGGHGADTGPFGARTFEFYNNVGYFSGYSDLTTFPMNQWMFVRGGTFVFDNNTLPALTSTDYGTKQDINMTVMNLQRNAGPAPCWGAGSTTGGYYYAPHQVGFGYVTGTGMTNYPTDSSTYSLSSYGYSTPEYVGDSEPAYIWGNSRQPLTNVGISDYGTGNADSCTGTVDTSANYIKANRDYFNGSTAKPGYTPYTYPHPLIPGTSAATPAPPTGLQATAQ
jgi:hypothetical protein